MSLPSRNLSVDASIERKDQNIIKCSIQEENSNSPSQLVGDVNLTPVTYEIDSLKKQKAIADKSDENSFEKIIVTDEDIRKLPSWLQDDYYDVMILYHEDDRVDAKEFKRHLMEEIRLGGNIELKAVLYDEIGHGRNNKLGSLKVAMDHCTYVFMFVTLNFVTDALKEFEREECIMQTLYEPTKRWCAIPVFTEPRKKAPYKIPMGLNSLKGLNYWSKDAFYEDSVRKIILDKLYTRIQLTKELEFERKKAIVKIRKQELYESALRNEQEALLRQQIDVYKEKLSEQVLNGINQSSNLFEPMMKTMQTGPLYGSNLNYNSQMRMNSIPSNQMKSTVASQMTNECIGISPSSNERFTSSVVTQASRDELSSSDLSFDNPSIASSKGFMPGDVEEDVCSEEPDGYFKYPVSTPAYTKDGSAPPIVVHHHHYYDGKNLPEDREQQKSTTINIIGAENVHVGDGHHFSGTGAGEITEQSDADAQSTNDEKSTRSESSMFPVQESTMGSSSSSSFLCSTATKDGSTVSNQSVLNNELVNSDTQLENIRNSTKTSSGQSASSTCVDGTPASKECALNNDNKVEDKSSIISKSVDQPASCIESSQQNKPVAVVMPLVENAVPATSLGNHGRDQESISVRTGSPINFSVQQAEFNSSAAACGNSQTQTARAVILPTTTEDGNTNLKTAAHSQECDSTLVKTIGGVSSAQQSGTPEHGNTSLKMKVPSLASDSTLVKTIEEATSVHASNSSEVTNKKTAVHLADPDVQKRNGQSPENNISHNVTSAKKCQVAAVSVVSNSVQKTTNLEGGNYTGIENNVKAQSKKLNDGSPVDKQIVAAVMTTGHPVGDNGINPDSIHISVGQTCGEQDLSKGGKKQSLKKSAGVLLEDEIAEDALTSLKNPKDKKGSQSGIKNFEISDKKKDRQCVIM